MAERRMFAKTIVLSDAFLDMPMSARCLYFTLGMFADDDGFVNSPRGIMRQCGASEDDMKVLLAKKFLLAFDSGVIVIKHWRINNYLRSDRYAETKYLDEKKSLIIDQNGAYVQPKEAGIPGGIPNSGIPRLGKDRLDKDSIGEVNTLAHPEVSEVVVETPFDTFWREYPKKKSKGQARTAFDKALKKTGFDTIMTALRALKETKQWTKNSGEFVPYPATWLNAEGWEDEVKSADGFDNLRGLYEMFKEDEDNAEK